MKTIVITAAVGLLGIAGLAQILGPDFNPLLKTAQQTMAEKLLAIVDHQELQLQRAKQLLENSRTAIAEQARQKAKLESVVDRFQTSHAKSQQIEMEERQKLSGMQRKLVAGETLFTSTGNPMSNRQVDAEIQLSTTRLESARQRTESMEKLLGLAQTRLDTLSAALPRSSRNLQPFGFACAGT